MPIGITGPKLNPQEEAIGILREVISDMTASNYDLVSILRRCQHVCEILGWQPAKAWFHQELSGYYPETPLPPHRKIAGTRKWQFEGSMYEGIRYQTDVSMKGLDPDVYDEEPDTLEVKAGIQWFLAASRSGYTEELSETKSAPSPAGRDRVTLRRVRSFQAGPIAQALSQIEKHVFDWASNSYVQLLYSNQVSGIWDSYRAAVDEAIQRLGLSAHLSAIQDGIASENPESWRAAVLECRNLLNDLANYLWLDPRAAYEPLPGSEPGNKLDVSQGKSVNRLSAYLHQKSVTGTEGRFLRDEAERLGASIRSLVSLESSAHDPVDRRLAESVVLSTFFVIGELALRTDLEPIGEYDNEAP